jgi:hypothetical protein
MPFSSYMPLILNPKVPVYKPCLEDIVKLHFWGPSKDEGPQKGIRKAILKIDSQVISGYVDKSSKARDPKLEKYLDAVRRLEASFEGFSVKNIPRGKWACRFPS